MDVLRRYLRVYFEKLSINPARNQFKLDLIDGFAGGGLFLSGKDIVSGTPLVMLEESDAAKINIRASRKKESHFDFNFYFIDSNINHIEHLREVLFERGYVSSNYAITTIHGEFERHSEEIIRRIRKHQPRAGRALFLLDQCGFSLVPFDTISKILRFLPNAEIILTFAADALVNHLTMAPHLLKAVEPLLLSEKKLEELIELRDGAGGRALVQRVLRAHLREVASVPFDTPFFIRPQQSRRALWFVHLSRHPTARDVMVQCHWDASNTFEHYGPGDFGMLGWDALKGDTLSMFRFEEHDLTQLRQQLLNTMPGELHPLLVDGAMSVEDIWRTFANRTAARNSDLFAVLSQLAQEGELEVLDASGKRLPSKFSRLASTDRIAIPRIPLLPGLSRRNRD